MKPFILIIFNKNQLVYALWDDYGANLSPYICFWMIMEPIILKLCFYDQGHSHSKVHGHGQSHAPGQGIDMAMPMAKAMPMARAIGPLIEANL